MSPVQVTIQFIESARLPTRFGTFTLHGFQDDSDGKEHLALTLGNPAENQPALTRVHSECLTGDALFSLRCDCGSQLESAMERIAHKGSGVILYLRQEGRNIGLGNKIRAYALQDHGADTVEANVQLGFEPDERLYHMCKPMLAHLGVARIELMTNNPVKLRALEAEGIDVSNRLPIITGENLHNAGYLAVKRSKMGHMPD